MPRVHHVMKARKANPNKGIAVGDEYYWWKFAFGPKMVSKTPPRRQQLTQSSFLQSLYDIEDTRDGLTADDGLPDAISELAQSLRDLASEQEDNRSNMPDQLQESDTGTLLQERADALNAAADELDGIDTDYEPDDDADEDEEQAHWDSILEQVQGVSFES